MGCSSIYFIRFNKRYPCNALADFRKFTNPFLNSTTVLTNYNDLPPADLALCQDTGRRILFSYSLEMFRDLFFVYQQTCMYRIKNKQKNLFYLYMLNKHANMYKTHMHARTQTSFSVCCGSLAEVSFFVWAVGWVSYT